MVVGSLLGACSLTDLVVVCVGSKLSSRSIKETANKFKFWTPLSFAETSTDFFGRLLVENYK